MALVRRFGLYGRYKSSSSPLSSVCSMRAFNSSVSLPWSWMESRMVFLRETSCAEIEELLFDGADLDLVEVAGGLLAVTGDEGNGRAFVEEFDRGYEALQGDLERAGNVNQEIWRKRLEFLHGRLILACIRCHGMETGFCSGSRTATVVAAPCGPTARGAQKWRRTRTFLCCCVLCREHR